MQKVRQQCHGLEPIVWAVGSCPEQLVAAMLDDRFYSEVYFGLTTHPKWRMFDCAGHRSMTPHCVRFFVMHVIWAGMGDAGSELERRLIASWQHDSRVANIRAGGEGSVTSALTFVYVCTNTMSQKVRLGTEIEALKMQHEASSAAVVL